MDWLRFYVSFDTKYQWVTSETLFAANPLASNEKIKSKRTKATTHQGHKDTVTQNYHKKGLVASYNLRPAPESGTWKIWYQIGMTHSPEVSADFWCPLSVLKSGLCAISLRVWLPSRCPRCVNFILTWTSRFPEARTPSRTEAINASLNTRQTTRIILHNMAVL